MIIFLIVGLIKKISLKTISNDLTKLSNVVENDVIVKTVYDEWGKKVNTNHTNDTSNLVKIADYITRFKRNRR